VPNSTKPSSALSPEDVGKRIKELRDQFSRTRNTLNTYRRKSNSESFSSIRRAQFKVCAEKKQVELEKMEKEMKSLEVAVTPPKKKCKKSSKHE
jgi:hypothetical protein